MDDLDFGATIKGYAPGQKIFGRYTLKKILGRGGMGVVWLAHDEQLERDVALKFLPEIVALDSEAVADLKRETRRNLDLTHANIVRIYDFVSDSRTAAISMEYVNGATLSALKVGKPARVFTTDEIRAWLGQLCEALGYAHTRAKVVHRDLKPANLMLTVDGELKITDFGIARGISDSVSRVSAQAGGSSGTPVYMSPQQMMGEIPAVTDDIYALGATLYELLTSKPPFYSGNVLLQVQNKVPPSLAERRKELEIAGEELPPEWEAAIAACLSKDPKDRPQNVGEFAQRLGLAGRQSVPGSAPVYVAAPVPSESPPALAVPPTLAKASQPGTPPPPADKAITASPGPGTVPTVKKRSWFLQWVLFPAFWGLLPSSALLFYWYHDIDDPWSVFYSKSAMAGLGIYWLFFTGQVSLATGLRRAIKAQLANRGPAADPQHPPLSRWLLAPLAAFFPAVAVSALFHALYGFALSEYSSSHDWPTAFLLATQLVDWYTGIISLQGSWLLFTLAWVTLLDWRQPWSQRGAWKRVAIPAMAGAGLGLFTLLGDVTATTVAMSVVASAYLSGFGGWLLREIALRVQEPGRVSAKLLPGLLAVGSVGMSALLFFQLPAAIRTVAAARQAEQERVRLEQERVEQERVRAQRAQAAPAMIAEASRMVFDRGPTPTEQAEYTALLVQHADWNAARLRQEMRSSAAGLKGGRLLVPEEFTTIRSAVDAAVPGNVIHVAAGTYKERVYLNKAVDLIGAGRDSVTVEIDCAQIALWVDGVKGVNVSGFTFRHTDTKDTTDRTAVVTFTGSEVNFSHNTIASANGMGVWISQEGRSHLSGNLIHGGRDNGVFLSVKGSAEIRGNEISGNSGMGIMTNSDAGSVTISENKITGNTTGVVCFGDKGAAEISNNEISDNSATGMNITGGSRTVAISDNKVRGNGSHGIYLGNGDNVTLTDNLVTGNGQNGYGITVMAGRPTLRGNIAHDNKNAGIWWDTTAQPVIGPGNFSDGKELPLKE